MFCPSGFAIISQKGEAMFYLFWFCNHFAEGGIVVVFCLCWFAIISQKGEAMFCPFWFCNHFAEGGRVVFVFSGLAIISLKGKRCFILSGFEIISLKEEELFCSLWRNYFADGGSVVLSSPVLKLFR